MKVENTVSGGGPVSTGTARSHQVTRLGLEMRERLLGKLRKAHLGVAVFKLLIHQQLALVQKACMPAKIAL